MISLLSNQSTEILQNKVFNCRIMFWALDRSEFQHKEWENQSSVNRNSGYRHRYRIGMCHYEPQSLQETIQVTAREAEAMNFLAGQYQGRIRGWANDCRNWNYALTFEGGNTSKVLRLKFYRHLIIIRLEKELE